MFKTLKEFDSAVYKILTDIVNGNYIMQGGGLPIAGCDALAHCIQEKLVVGLKIGAISPRDGLPAIEHLFPPRITRAGLVFIEQFAVEGQ